jgi:aerobic carbon-monoxide dehydrogenase large subunit
MTITEAPADGAATTGAPPAVINAIIDPLSGLGVDDVPMSPSPLNLWNAIPAAQGGSQ